MKKVIITVPDNCEIQVIEQSKENIENKKDKEIRTYQDLIDNNILLKGYYVSYLSNIRNTNVSANDFNKNIAASEKVAKSMLAMAMISQLMPYYGGEITEEEWKRDTFKFIIKRRHNKIETDYYNSIYNFLAFHTEEQRDDFLKYNEQLVKDYLMID